MKFKHELCYISFFKFWKRLAIEFGQKAIPIYSLCFLLNWVENTVAKVTLKFHFAFGLVVKNAIKQSSNCSFQAVKALDFKMAISRNVDQINIDFLYSAPQTRQRFDLLVQFNINGILSFLQKRPSQSKGTFISSFPYQCSILDKLFDLGANEFVSKFSMPLWFNMAVRRSLAIKNSQEACTCCEIDGF